MILLGRRVKSYENFETGQNVDIDTAAEQLAPSSTFESSHGVYIKALAANTDKIYIGHDNTVTAADGYELSAGDELFIPLSHVKDIWVIAAAINQKACYIAI